MFHFLETDIREQKKYEMRTQTSVDNTVNDLHYETKFENCVKDKNNFFIKRNIALLCWTKIYFIFGGIFFKIPKNLITSVFFLPRQILKNIDMPRQKPLMLHWWNLLIESLKMIMWLTAQCFSASDLNVTKQRTGIEIAFGHRTFSDRKC